MRDIGVAKVWEANGRRWLRLGAAAGSDVANVLHKAGWSWRRASAAWSAPEGTEPPVPYCFV